MLLPHILFLFSPFVKASDTQVWNGYHDSAPSTATFTPFYVPPGATLYNASSSYIRYTGSWRRTNLIASTIKPGSSLSLSFTGSRIEWFGCLGPDHGVADVFIDNRHVASVDGWFPCEMCQQRIWSTDSLSPGVHELRMINTLRRTHGSLLLDVYAFVISSVSSSRFPRPRVRRVTQGESIDWAMEQIGNSGVNAMQLAVISPTHALIVDKVEHNLVSVDGHPAWAALYNLNTHKVRPLRMQSNSFCAGGSFLSNGTLINVGGNPVVADDTGAADFGDVNGLQAVRLFAPCLSESDGDNSCDIYENPTRIRLASPRWYNTVLRISDGSAMIIGGSKKGGWINNSTTNNPTIEFYPAKSIHNSNGSPIHLPLLDRTLNANLFPIAFSLPGSQSSILVIANTEAIIYDWTANSERRLPSIPNGVRVTYPMTGTALLLPLDPAKNYEPEILVCGGSPVDDTRASYDISSQETASDQCARLLLTDSGIQAGWKVERMPQARIMPDAVLLPTGQVFLVNGGASGMAGYGNVKHQVGKSNADHPVLSPVLYDPSGPDGARFISKGMPHSTIARLYHSVATLVPDGRIMIAGSNPNLDRSDVEYGTEYRVEWISPPYMKQSRPFITRSPSIVGFGIVFKVSVNFPSSVHNVRVALMDLGYVTHSVHANSRLVYLTAEVPSGIRNAADITATSPPDGGIYPPGPAWLFIIADGTPSKGVMIMIGDGNSPPVDIHATNAVLQQPPSVHLHAER